MSIIEVTHDKEKNNLEIKVNGFSVYIGVYNGMMYNVLISILGYIPEVTTVLNVKPNIDTY